jgi:hypothetical protein
MKQVFKFDEEGYFVEPVLIGDKEEVPEGCMDVVIPEGLYRPQWNGAEIVEGLSQLEIDQLHTNAPDAPLTYKELLAENKELKERVGSMEFAVITVLDRI